MGFLILNAILGGQALVSASSGGLSPDVGIVIMALITLFVRTVFSLRVCNRLCQSFVSFPYQLTFCGYRVITIYERYAWIPVIIVFVIATAVGGKHLTTVVSVLLMTAPLTTP